jgi:uncharacterized protein involved in response to NO
MRCCSAYAQAVVAGFLLARLGRSELALPLCAWVAARVVAVVPDPGLLLAAAGNRLFAPIFMGFLLAEVIDRGGQLGLLPEGERQGLMLAVDLVTLLLVLMGGRVIPAATAGALHRRGQQLRSRVQAGLERATLASLMIVIVSDLLSLWGVAAAGALGARVLTALRLAHWRTVAIRDQPEL